MRGRRKSLTLIELIIAVVAIIILSGISIPIYNKSKERALGKEAIANLKLIVVAEKIYRMEPNTYYPSSDTVTAIADINSNLKIDLTETNWDYSVTGGASTFTAYADRNGAGRYLDCQYSITQSQNDPVPNANCP